MNKEFSIIRIISDLLKTNLEGLDIWNEIEGDIAVLCSDLPYVIHDSKRNDFIKMLKNIKTFLSEKDINPSDLKFMDKVIEKYARPSDKNIQILAEKLNVGESYEKEREYGKEIIEFLSGKINNPGIYYGNFSIDYDILKKIMQMNYEKTGNLNFLVGKNMKMVGKITHSLYDHPLKVRLCQGASKKIKDTFIQKVFFMDERKNENQWSIDSELSEEFWIYEMIFNKKKYLVFSKDEMELEEYNISGMIVECDDLAKMGLNMKIRTISPILFVSEKKSRIVKYANHKELFNEIEPLKLNEDKFFNFLFSRSDGYSYRHPKYFEWLIGAYLFSAKRNKEDYPLHLLILAKHGTGKTFLIEALHNKMCEQQEIIEGSGSTLKSIVPSFKDIRPEAGNLARANRICIIDEFLRILMRVRPEERENHLTMMNPLLEHKRREFGSGNGRITLKPTAKLLAVTNPVYGTKDMVDLCSKIDSSFISRMLIFFQSKEHIKWVEDEKGKCVTESKIPSDIWLSIYDYMQTFTSLYDQDRVKGIHNLFVKFLEEGVADVYSRRYKQHHIFLLMDGIIKLRCILSNDSSFSAIEEDYDTLLAVWKSMVFGWKESNDLANITDFNEKIKYLTREQKYILEELENKGRIRDDEVSLLDCPEPLSTILSLQEIGLAKREGHYFLIKKYGEIIFSKKDNKKRGSCVNSNLLLPK